MWQRATRSAFYRAVNFPSAPTLPTESDWTGLDGPMPRLDWAAENPALLRQQGLEVAMTTSGLETTKRNSARISDRRWTAAFPGSHDALAALTTVRRS